eukprot:TRINITY_DN112465_c0_g1_i1.p1 TRINITY_DN112465_c0_g1~~TRINITY_DN112465_c0_g1_i1.p1  ORF type:complete len:823 (+),score=70.30 TRINITY_DN112465_c0_g1_i1:27-2495(+)
MLLSQHNNLFSPFRTNAPRPLLFTLLSCCDVLSKLAAHLHHARTTARDAVKEILRIIQHVTMWRDLWTTTEKTPLLFISSSLMAMLDDPQHDADTIFLATTCFNNILRLPGALAILHSAWQTGKGTPPDICLQITEPDHSDLRVPLYNSTAVFKRLVAMLNKRDEAIIAQSTDHKLRTLACLSYLLLTPPEEPRSAKLFSSSTLTKTFSVCLTSMETKCTTLLDGAGVDMAELNLTTDLLNDMLSLKPTIAASFVDHATFSSVLNKMCRILPSPICPLQIITALKVVVTSLSTLPFGSSHRNDVAGIISNVANLRLLLDNLMTPDTSTCDEMSAEKWNARLELMLTMQQALSDNSILQACVTSITTELKQALQGQSQECNPHAVLLLSRLSSERQDIKNAIIAELPLDLFIQFQTSLLSATTKEENTTSTTPSLHARKFPAHFHVVTFYLALHLYGEDILLKHKEVVVPLLGVCAASARTTQCGILLHVSSTLHINVVKKMLSNCTSEEANTCAAAVAKMMVYHQPQRATTGRTRLTPEIRSVSDTTMTTDGPFFTPTGADDELRISQERIHQLLERDRAKQLRLEALTTQYKQLEDTVDALKSARGSTEFDRDKQEELNSLRRFREKHLSSQQISDSKIEELTEELAHKSKNLEEAYMKLVLMTKVYQKNVVNVMNQQHKNADLISEIDRMKQEWGLKDEKYTSSLRSLQEKLEAGAHERLTQGKTNAISIQALEAELAKSSNVIHQLRMENSGLKTKVQNCEQQNTTQVSQLQECNAGLKAAQGKIADLEGKLHRYSSVNMMIKNLVEDPEAVKTKQNEA